MKRTAVCAAVLGLWAAPAHAQNRLLNECAPDALIVTAEPDVPIPAEVREQFRFLCTQVVTAIGHVQPSVGIAFSGGAHTLGTATTIGRRLGVLPRIAVTARVNAALADVPDLLDDFDPTFDDQGQIPPLGTVGIPVGALQGDVTLGLFKGFSLGPVAGGLGAVDLLGSLSYVPAVEPVGLSEAIVNVGLGARVGILQQGLIMPGISISGMYRTLLDDVAFGDLSEGDPAEFSTDLSTLSLRAAISKGILMFDLAAGAGYDVYRSDVAFDFELTCPPEQCDGQTVVLGTDGGVDGRLTTAAWNAYGSVGLSLVLLNIVGEVGYHKATDVIDTAALLEARLPARAPTREELEGGRFFASLGVRLSL